MRIVYVMKYIQMAENSIDWAICEGSNESSGFTKTGIYSDA
jgi:hypothetical protein